MKSSIYKIYLDIHNYGSHVLLKAKKGDTCSVLYITLMDGKNPYALTPECYAVFTAKKADGNILYNKCSIVENMIVYEFTHQTTSTAGRVSCEIKLYGSEDTLLTSAEFTLIVMDTVYNETDEVGSVKEVTALTDLVSHATTLISNVENKLAKGEFVGAKGDKGDKGDRGLTGPVGLQGDRGPQGVSGVVVYPEGHFALEVDSATGDLYFVSEDDVAECPFTLDNDGNLYYEILEG